MRIILYSLDIMTQFRLIKARVWTYGPILWFLYIFVHTYLFFLSIFLYIGKVYLFIRPL